MTEEFKAIIEAINRQTKALMNLDVAMANVAVTIGGTIFGVVALISDNREVQLAISKELEGIEKAREELLNKKQEIEI